MLNCVILGMSQNFDFEQNAAVTYLALRLPNNEVIQIAIDEETAATVIAMQVKQAGVPGAPASPRPPPVRAAAQAPAPRPPPAPEAPDDAEPSDYAIPPGKLVPAGESTFVFGGADVPEDFEARSAEEAEAIAEGSPTLVVVAPPSPAAPARTNMQVLPNGKVIVPSRTVPSAIHGYPNAPNGGIDPNDFLGNRDQDEDGVGSV